MLQLKMTTPIKVYYAPPSPPSRVVLMTAKALGVPVEPRIVDLAKGEHMEPQYLQVSSDVGRVQVFSLLEYLLNSALNPFSI